MIGEQRTHLLANEKFCGRVLKIKDGEAEVELLATPEMTVDEKGLVHGGFTFSLADLSAMVAVNHPFVVLAEAKVKFLRPVKVGDRILSKAKVVSSEGSKRIVSVEVFKDGEKVLEGEFLCVITKKHVLD